MEEQKKATDKALDAANRLSKGESSINQIRVEYRLEAINKSADKLFITKE